MKNKRIMSAAMAVLMAGSLAACGGSASSTADSTAAESTSTAASTEATAESTDEPVTIRITWWGGQTRHDLTQQVLDLYTSEHPNVTFEAVPSGWDGYFEKLATDTATGQRQYHQNGDECNQPMPSPAAPTVIGAGSVLAIFVPARLPRPAGGGHLCPRDSAWRREHSLHHPTGAGALP